MAINKNGQQGITFIGICLMLGILACFVLFGLRLFPLYNEHLGIKTSMAAVMNQPKEKRKNIADIRKIFLKNANINSLAYFNSKNVKEHVTIKKSEDGKKKYFHVKYENSNNLFKNIFLTVKTDEAIELVGAD